MLSARGKCKLHHGFMDKLFTLSSRIWLSDGLCFRWGFIHREVTHLITGHVCPSSWPSIKIYRTRERRIKCKKAAVSKDIQRPCVNVKKNVHTMNTLVMLLILYVENATKKNSPSSCNPINEYCVPFSIGSDPLLIYVTIYS